MKAITILFMLLVTSCSSKKNEEQLKLIDSVEIINSDSLTNNTSKSTHIFDFNFTFKDSVYTVYGYRNEWGQHSSFYILGMAQNNLSKFDTLLVVDSIGVYTGNKKKIVMEYNFTLNNGFNGFSNLRIVLDNTLYYNIINNINTENEYESDSQNIFWNEKINKFEYFILNDSD